MRPAKIVSRAARAAAQRDYKNENTGGSGVRNQEHRVDFRLRVG